MRPGDKQAQFAGQPALAKRELELRRDYHLDALRSSASADNYAENLYYLELFLAAAALGQELGWRPADRLDVADIGVSHWFYAQALLAGLTWWACDAARQVHIDGFEADPWRLHADLFTRGDHALAHTAGLAELDFRPVPFVARPAAYHAVTMFFPFVFLADHRRWGLPTTMHQPEVLLEAAWRSLAPGGLLVVVNQGDAEQAAQRSMMAQAGLPTPLSVPFDCGFYQYRVPRRLTVVCRS